MHAPLPASHVRPAAPHSQLTRVPSVPGLLLLVSHTSLLTAPAPPHGRVATQASAIALGPCKLPLPSFGKSGLGHDYGAIGSPASYIADVPDVVK